MKIKNSKANKIFEVLKKSPKFQKYIKEKRISFVEGLDNKEPLLSDILKNKIPKPAEIEAKEIAKETTKKFYIPSYWLESLSNYYLTGNLKIPTVPFIAELTIDECGYRQLSLHISKSTTIKDIKENWLFIKNMQKMVAEIKAISIDDSQYAIYELRSSGIANKEVIKILEEDYDQTLDSYQIDVTFSRMKKILG